MVGCYGEYVIGVGFGVIKFDELAVLVLFDILLFFIVLDFDLLLLITFYIFIL